MKFSSGKRSHRSIVRQLVRAVRGSYFGFPTQARSSARRCFGHISHPLRRLLAFFCSQVPRQFLGLGWWVGDQPSLPADRLQSRACILAGQPDQVPAVSGLKTFSQNISREKLDALECPVCLCPASAPIYACPEPHIICSNCLPRYLCSTGKKMQTNHLTV